MQKAVLFLGILVLFFCLPFVSFAYKTMGVKEGGNIEGIVEFTGASVPKDETLTLTSEIELCGKYLPAEKYLISAERRIKNVVVYIDAIEAGKPIPSEPVTVTNVKCAFVPHVGIGFEGNSFTALNDDPLFHIFHISTSINGKHLFSIGLHERGLKVSKPLTKTGITEITCDVHPWMHGYVYIFHHPYAAVTNEKGEFVIKDIPPGSYTVGAWHEALGKLRQENVRINSGETSRIKLEYNWNINLK